MITELKMSNEEKSSKKWYHNTLWSFSALFVGGVAIFTLAFLITLWDFLLNMVTKSVTVPLDIFTTYLPIYLGISFAYCFIISISVNPKTIIPIHWIQIATGSIIFILMVVLNSLYLTQSHTAFTWVVALLTGFLFFIIGFASYYFTGLMKRVIGVSGNKESLEEKVFAINRPFKKIKKALTNKTFRKIHQIKVIEDDDQKIVIRSIRDDDLKITIVATPNKKNDEESVICIIGTEILQNIMKPTDLAKTYVHNLTREIPDQLVEDKIVPKIDNSINNTYAEELAEDHALRPTKNIFKRIRPRLIGIFSITFLVGIGIFIIFYNNLANFNLGEFVVSEITLLALITPFIIPVIKGRNRKEYD